MTFLLTIDTNQRPTLIVMDTNSFIIVEIIEGVRPKFVWTFVLIHLMINMLESNRWKRERIKFSNGDTLHTWQYVIDFNSYANAYICVSYIGLFYNRQQWRRICSSIRIWRNRADFPEFSM